MNDLIEPKWEHCCGEVDSSGTCLAPACSFGSDYGKMCRDELERWRKLLGLLVSEVGMGPEDVAQAYEVMEAELERLTKQLDDAPHDPDCTAYHGRPAGYGTVYEDECDCWKSRL
jgi:hypothetical protein